MTKIEEKLAEALKTVIGTSEIECVEDILGEDCPCCVATKALAEYEQSKQQPSGDRQKALKRMPPKQCRINLFGNWVWNYYDIIRQALQQPEPEVVSVKDFVDIFCRIGAHWQQDIYHDAKPVDMAERVIKAMKKYPNGLIIK